VWIGKPTLFAMRRNDTPGGNKMPAAFFVVRATVTDSARRQAFGAWYSREHLPDAVKSFGATKAWRYWSEKLAEELTA
jgi:hypothetical protein